MLPCHGFGAFRATSLINKRDGVAYRGGPAWPWLGAAAVYAAGLAFSLATNVRINALIERWSVKNPRSEWVTVTVRRRWVRFHIVCTIVQMPGLVPSLIALAG